jgi:hypothetical protein
MNKETDMNTDKLETLIAILKNLNSDSLDRVITALQDELWGRQDAAEELAKEDYDAMLALQYA